MYVLVKNLFYLNSLVLITLSFISFFFLSTIMSNSFVIDYNISPMSPITFNYSISIDKQSLLFMSTVGVVSSMVISYSYFYLKDSSSDRVMKKFLLILMSFIISMFVLSSSSSLYWLMVGWDGLGISSMCLIIFYLNWKSFSSGMVTFLTNRIGDIFIIVVLVILSAESSLSSWVLSFVPLLFFFLFFGSYSKSAQIPYLYWLPQAMAAPTPVSALVHSSTLVTAGVYSICRFSPTPLPPNSVSTIFFVISCLTVMVAGTSSLFEFDLKKIIALSTLCHVSLMMMFSVIGEKDLSLFHLMMHALFKSLLFMIAGHLIHYSNSYQDIRRMTIMKLDIKMSFPFILSIFSMMGIPFLSGYYSKESLLSSSTLNFPSVVMVLMFLVNSFFSCAYSIRILLFLLFSNKYLPMSTFSKEFGPILWLGSFLSSVSAGVVIFFVNPEEQEMIQSVTLKMMLMATLILGILTGLGINSFSPSLSKFLISTMSSMWKSDFIYKIFQENFFLSSKKILWEFDEKGTMKFLWKKSITTFKSFSYLINELMVSQPLIFILLIHFMMSFQIYQAQI